MAGLVSSTRIKTTTKDTGARRIRNLARMIARNRPGTKVGVQELEGDHVTIDPATGREILGPHPVPVVMVAYWNEYGTVHMPERAFMRVTFAETKNSMVYEMRNQLQDLMRGNTTMAKVQNYLGRLAQKNIRTTIRTWTSPPDAPLTIAKNFTKKRAAMGVPYKVPLKVTGQLLRAIKYLKTGSNRDDEGKRIPRGDE